MWTVEGTYLHANARVPEAQTPSSEQHEEKDLLLNIVSQLTCSCRRQWIGSSKDIAGRTLGIGCQPCA